MRSLIELVRSLRGMPEISIDLMEARTVGNDPFYHRLVRDFFAASHRRHRRCPVILSFKWGVAVCVMPGTFDDYFMLIEAAARRNYKKALRSGYVFRRMNYNDHLTDIRAVRRSTPVRQGVLSKAFLESEVRPCANPPSRSSLHDYPYFGVFKDEQLVAYGGGMVAGEVFCLEQIYGHAAFQADGVVPMLIIGTAEYLYETCPNVRYYAYGTFFGAGETLRRFKKKFRFLPHKVTWVLNGE